MLAAGWSGGASMHALQRVPHTIVHVVHTLESKIYSWACVDHAPACGGPMVAQWMAVES